MLGWMTDRAVAEGSPVVSDSGEEGSKSSRERLAILQTAERGVNTLISLLSLSACKPAFARLSIAKV